MSLQNGSRGSTATSSLSTSTDTEGFWHWYAQGEALANGEDYGRALRCFEEAAVIAPLDSAVLLYQAVCLIHLGQPQKALAVTEVLVNGDPAHAQGWLFRGVALNRLGRFQEAYASYDRATALAT
ncbi:MAG: tetratricopeptide repeat protein [Nodosilinea sp.]